MRRLFKFLALPSIALALLVGLLISAWFYTYQRLTDETPIAEISFEPLGDKAYRASLATGDFCNTDRYDVYGDQWRIDVQFVKWRYWATLLGFDSMYRLDRLEGRYEDVAEQNGRVKVAYSLAPATAIDLTKMAAALGRLNFVLDAEYGSSTFDRIDPGKRYRVYKTPTGLMTRSEPRAIGEDRGGRLSVRIDRACGREPGLWRRLADRFDGLIGRIRTVTG